MFIKPKMSYEAFSFSARKNRGTWEEWKTKWVHFITSCLSQRMANAMSMWWTPSSQHVEEWVNPSVCEWDTSFLIRHSPWRTPCRSSCVQFPFFHYFAFELFPFFAYDPNMVKYLKYRQNAHITLEIEIKW